MDEIKGVVCWVGNKVLVEDLQGRVVIAAHMNGTLCNVVKDTNKANQKDNSKKT
jgi:hypothetical protein